VNNLRGVIFTLMLDSLLSKWHLKFGSAKPEVIVRAPGRVNIIGEHTDYNEGWVLPGAMSKSVYMLVSRGNKDHHWIADNMQEEYKASSHQSENEMPVWAKYILGALKIYDTKDSAFNILIGGDLPVGAGVSSSSSLVCGLLFGFQKIFGREDSNESIALLGSRVEREVIGLQGGIMDQFAIMLSKVHHVMLLDCRTRNYEFIPADLPGCNWLLVNTKVRHQLIDTDYNERADECQRAVAIMQHQYPEINSLRDVTSSMLSSIHLPPTLARRVKFVLEENERVHNMVKALGNKDSRKAGQLLKASHKGLRNDYEVSCAELDHLADFANHFEGVHGARMMGGGFGGCVLCLVDKKSMDDFIEEIKTSYFLKFNYDPEIIEVELGNGVEEVKQKKKVK
jgi:galactokinase